MNAVLLHQEQSLALLFTGSSAVQIIGRTHRVADFGLTAPVMKLPQTLYEAASSLRRVERMLAMLGASVSMRHFSEGLLGSLLDMWLQ